MPDIVLGLNAYHADSSAAIFLDGVLLAATEEERFRRIKHWAGFPSEAIKFASQKPNARWQTSKPSPSAETQVPRK